jgi:hypothetical protein
MCTEDRVVEDSILPPEVFGMTKEKLLCLDKIYLEKSELGMCG